MWIYQEILHEVRPGVIVETGTFSGGSALYLANICDILGSGRILTIDLDPQPDLPEHPRITYIRGSSISPEVVDRVRELSQGQTVMAILDSDHHADHVLAEMRAYAPLIKMGSYLVVEDTNVNGNPVLPDWGPGPREAVQRFLAETDAFVVDREREKFFMTFNPGGYLKRVR
jgi:cephalosporin hydroxylase